MYLNDCTFCTVRELDFGATASETYGARSLSRGGNAALWEADATKVQWLQAGSRASPGRDYEYLRSAVVRDVKFDRETEQRQA